LRFAGRHPEGSDATLKDEEVKFSFGQLGTDSFILSELRVSARPLLESPRLSAVRTFDYAEHMAKNFTDIWKSLPADDRQRAAEAFWADESMRAQQQGMLQQMAKRYNFRTKSMQSLPPSRKAKMLLEIPGLAPELLMNLLAAFHLHYRKEMLGDFLDALGIAHEGGFMKESEGVESPTEDAVRSAVETLKTKYPAQDVDVYLNVLYLQDPEFWKGLKTILS